MCFVNSVVIRIFLDPSDLRFEWSHEHVRWWRPPPPTTNTHHNVLLWKSSYLKSCIGLLSVSPIATWQRSLSAYQQQAHLELFWTLSVWWGLGRNTSWLGSGEHCHSNFSYGKLTNDFFIPINPLPPYPKVAPLLLHWTSSSAAKILRMATGGHHLTVNWNMGCNACFHRQPYSIWFGFFSD